MTLRSVLKVAVGGKYRITMKHLDGEYETIVLDYTGDNERFSKALKRRNEFMKMKHEVKWITANNAAECLEITLYAI